MNGHQRGLRRSEDDERKPDAADSRVDSLLLGEGGHRTISKVTPSFVHNTVDNPIFPNSGTRLTGSIDFAGIGERTLWTKLKKYGLEGE